MRRLMAQEREIIISKQGDQKSWDIYCSIKTLKTKLIKLAKEYKTNIIKIDSEGIRVVLPLRAIVFKGPPKAARVKSGKRLAGGKNAKC